MLFLQKENFKGFFSFWFIRGFLCPCKNKTNTPSFVLLSTEHFCHSGTLSAAHTEFSFHCINYQTWCNTNQSQFILYYLHRQIFIGTSYLAQFQKRAVTNLKNYLTKNYENLRKPKEGQKQPFARANISAR